MIEDRVAASDEQLEVWLAVAREPETGRYNIPLDLEFRPGADPAVLLAALSDVLGRHPGLRSSFATTADGQVVQEVHAEPPLSFAITEHPGRYDRPAALAWAATVGALPLDLTTAPLARAHLWRATDGALLVLVVHHIVADGWSMQVITEHLAAAYRARLHARPSPLERRNRLAVPSGPAEHDDRYWRELLAAEPPALQPMPDLIRPGTEPGSPGSAVRTLPTGTLAGIRELARREGASPAVVILAGYTLLLHAWSGMAEGTVGMLFAGRMQPHLLDETGLLARTLPVVSALRPDRRFTDVLAGLRDQVLESLDHSMVAGRRLRGMRPDGSRDTSIYLHMPVGGGSTGDGVDITVLDHDIANAKFDFALAAEEGPDGLSVRVDFDAALYRRSTAGVFLDQMVTLLAEVAAKPDRTCSELLAAADREATRCARGAPAGERLVPRLVLDQALQRPDAVAVRHGDRTLTYRQLTEQAARLAHEMIGAGVRPGDLVALLQPVGVEVPLAWLAVLLAGAAYLPLDPGYPDAQLRMVLDDARPRLVLTDAGQQGRVPAHGRVQDLLAASRDRPADPPPIALTGDDVFNVLFTSGSTGRPRGVVLPHRGVARLLGRPEFVGLDHTDVVSHLSPVNFDGATYEIWGALAHGAELVVLDKDLVLSPRDLRDALRRDRVTTLLVTTPLLNRIVEDAPDLLQALRRVYFGGELISVPHLRRALRWAAPGVLLHSYGPTENSFTSTWHPITAIGDAARTLPIGAPVPGTQAYVVLDGTLDPAPRGVPGELLLGGVGVAHGYLGDPAATADRFVPDPFGDRPGARLYRTGDRVRWTPGGQLEFVGRRDNQVKIRSQRVELGEVEAALAAHPAVDSVFVTTWRDARGDKTIAAYLAGSCGVEAIREHARAALPAFAVPSSFTFLPQLPLNPNGKIDRKRLPAPAAAPAVDAPAAGTTVSEVHAAWRELLGRDDVDVDQNFFDAGGHSLMVVQLQAALRRHLGVTVPIGELLRHTTVRAQAAYADGLAPEERPWIRPAAAARQAVARPAGAAWSGPVILAVSARSARALHDMRGALADHLENYPDIRVGDVARTLDVGRERFALRWAAVVTTVAEAVAALRAPADPVQAGEVPHDAAPGEPAEAARLWCRGAAVRLTTAGQGRRIHLPAYAFDRVPAGAREEDA